MTMTNALQHFIRHTPDVTPDAVADRLYTLLGLDSVAFHRPDFQTAVYEIVKHFNDRSPRIGVVALSPHEGKLLLGWRKGSHCPGVLANAGGRQDFGKTLEQTAVDEVHQETGLRVEVVPYQSNQTWFMKTEDIIQSEQVHFHTFWFLTRHLDPNPQPVNKEPHKCNGWGWYSWDDIMNEYRSLNPVESDKQLHWLPVSQLSKFRSFLKI